MFAVYNTNGLSFRSTVDNLYNLKNIDALSKTQNQTQESKPQNFSVPHESLYQGAITKEAKDAYKKMAKIDTREEIYHVKQIMSSDVVCVNEDMTIQECYELMIEKKIKQIPVKSSEGILHGMITQEIILDYLINDLDYAEHTANKSLINLELPQTITSDPITDIRRVAKVMVDFNLNAMPVVSSDDEIVGIVSRTDILKAVSSVPPLQIWA